LNSEEGGLQFLGSSGRITVSGYDCSIIGKGGSEGVIRGWKVSCIKYKIEYKIKIVKSAKFHVTSGVVSYKSGSIYKMLRYQEE
jgi:hypothetical protein